MKPLWGRRELTLGGWFYGKWYRFWMKLAHRFGFCWPQPMPVDPSHVWCHWCGMRGTKLIKGPEWERAVAEKMAAVDSRTSD